MADADPSGQSGFDGTGAASSGASDAFALLGDETRLAILLALWERFDPHAGDNAVPFSELKSLVGYDNPGNFRYHLEKLEGHFIRQRTERGGYELRMPGLKLVKAVIAGLGLDDDRLEPTELDQPCPLCGAGTTLAYRSGLVIHACTECHGPTPARTATEGFLSAVPFEPAGLADRSPAEIRAASRIAAIRQTHAMFDGVCPTCSGPVESWLECCPEHESDGVCEACGTEFVAWVRFRCRICRDHANSSPKALALLHPRVMGFYADHGISTRFHLGDPDGLVEGFELLDAHEMELVSEAPPTVAVTATVDDDTLTVVFDEAVDVVEVQ